MDLKSWLSNTQGAMMLKWKQETLYKQASKQAHTPVQEKKTSQLPKDISS